MKENDPLHSVLREWAAPEPSSAVEEGLRAGFRGLQRPSLWQRVWSAEVRIPVPVLAALLLVAVVSVLYFRPRPSAAPPSTAAPPSETYMSRIEAAGFQPLRDGATRVIRSGEKQ
jgi:hypothetical protein